MNSITNSDESEYGTTKFDSLKIKDSLYLECSSIESAWSENDYTIQFDNKNYYVNSIVDGKITLKKK